MRWKGQGIPTGVIDDVVAHVFYGKFYGPDVRQAIKYLSPSLVVTATRRHRPDGRARTAEVVVTVGAPNHRARAYIKTMKRAGQSPPFKYLQLRYWPVKARKAA